jgi:hypothetical protein
VPAEGISPYQEFMRDTRGLTFLDTSLVSEAFLHHETENWTMPDVSLLEA